MKDSLPPKVELLHNLPPVQESGFFGRSRELWQIERGFAVQHCRRFSITGFGGQGKTALACEAGRWLLRTKLFLCACFVISGQRSSEHGGQHDERGL